MPTSTVGLRAVFFALVELGRSSRRDLDRVGGDEEISWMASVFLEIRPLALLW